MNKSTLIKYEKGQGGFYYYNIVTQTLIEVDRIIEDVQEEQSEQVKDAIFFGTEEMDIINFNRSLLKNSFEELQKEKEIFEPFNDNTLYIILWKDCNFRCPYCYQNQEYYIEEFGSEQIIIDIERVTEFIDKKTVKPENKPGKITLMGGEPFLEERKYKDSLLLLLNFISNKFDNMDVWFITNGYNMDQYLPILREFDNIHWTFKITLGVTEEQHKKTRILKKKTKENTFHKIKENMLLLDSELKNKEFLIRYNIDDKIDNLSILIDKMHLWVREISKVSFEISMITYFDKVVRMTDTYIKLILDVRRDNILRNHVTIKFRDTISTLIESILNEKEIELFEPRLCNAYTLEGMLQISPPFEIQPCDELGIYEKYNENKIGINESRMHNLHEEINDRCLNCGFFMYCIANLCQITQFVKIENCYEVLKKDIMIMLNVLEYDNQYTKKI